MSNEEPTKRLPEGFDLILVRLDSFERNMTEQMDSFKRDMNVRMDSFDERLAALEEKGDQRLMEPRPIWEAVLARLTEAQNYIRDIKYKLRALNDSILDVVANQRYLEDRVDKLERQPS